MIRQHSNADWEFQGSSFEEQLLEQMKPLLAFAFHLTKTRERAEDLRQETYLRAIMNQDKFVMGTNLRAWLFTIMRNLWYTKYRRSLREQPLDPEMAEAIPAPREDLKFEHEEQIASDLGGLLPIIVNMSKDKCDAFIAVHYLELTYDQAAALFGVPIGTVKSRIHRGFEEINLRKLTKRQRSFDLTHWATATHGISKDDPYYPIAKAYEDIFTFIVTRANLPSE